MQICKYSGNLCRMEQVSSLVGTPSSLITSYMNGTCRTKKQYTCPKRKELNDISRLCEGSMLILDGLIEHFGEEIKDRKGVDKIVEGSKKIALPLLQNTITEWYANKSNESLRKELERLLKR